MRKILLLAILFSTLIYAQDNDSSTRKFIDGAEFTQTNKDWNIVAEFESGIGESVKFFPIEIVNLKTNENIKALQLDMMIKKDDVSGKQKEYFRTSWIGIEEIDEFVNFLELYIVPNIETEIKDKKKSTMFTFNAKEMVLRYKIEKGNKRISIYLKNSGVIDEEYYFWTQSQVDEVPNLVKILKKIK